MSLGFACPQEDYYVCYDTWVQSISTSANQDAATTYLMENLETLSEPKVFIG